MAKLAIQVASTSQTINLFIQDSSSTTGAGLTGLVFNTSSLTATYALPRAASVAITLATLAAVTSAYSSGGFKEIDSSLMPGWYRFDIPDAALASGRFVSIHLKGATNMAPLPLEIELTGWNNQDAVRGGLTTLPNAAAAAAGGLITSGGTGNVLPTDAIAAASIAANAITSAKIATDAIGAAQIATDAIGSAELATSAVTEIQAAVAAGAVASVTGAVGSIASGGITTASFAAGAINAAAIATDALGSLELAADAVTEIQSGLATSAALATAQADLDDIQTRLPAALVSGRMDASVGAMAANTLTATAIATDAITAAKIAADAIGASELAADAVTEIQAAVAAGAVASVTGAVGSVTGNVGGNVVGSVGSVVAGVTLAAAAVQAIWDALTSALTTAGSIGKLLVDNINATISSRLASASYTAPDNTSIATILTRADVATSTRLATSGYTAAPTAVQNADALLDRDMSTGADSGSTTVRTPRQALRFLRNKRSISGTTMTVTKEDDATASFTATLTTSPTAELVTSVDPAG